ncbi:uncharacterized protein LOC133729421 isoform X9 [Rosa rugosa]|uniref:uncharacterized protein LOC133729421 isoform X9 n=1 Tax=Rosa rugosa TaxID=74645 RepID=UPI002B412FD3|nr:uncharacterized protein LOC133729421 isoform X9 [Rosa rugosa]XP_062012933.1 uncharacterized protein LOC133729421 isoform X9 [Rosa rugosa]
MAGMSSRTKGPRNRELKRLQAEKPLFIQKRDKPAGSKVRKSKHHSPAGPSHGAVTSSRFSSADGKHSADGSKVTQQELAKMCAIRDWCKDSCSYYNPKELRSPPGAEPLERKVATCPHQGMLVTRMFLVSCFVNPIVPVVLLAVLLIAATSKITLVLLVAMKNKRPLNTWR